MKNVIEETRRNDFKWFCENRDILYNKYGKKFIAIKNKTVLGVYCNMVEAIDTTAQNYKLGTFIVQECDDPKMDRICSIVTPGIIK